MCPNPLGVPLLGNASDYEDGRLRSRRATQIGDRPETPDEQRARQSFDWIVILGFRVRMENRMVLIAAARSIGQHAVHSRPAYSKCCRDRAGRFTASVHPLRQCSLLLIKYFGATDVLSACPTRLPSRSAPLPAKLKFKLSEAGQDAGNHPTCGVRCVDALSNRTEHDPTLAEFADSRHHLGGVAAQAVDADHHDGVAFVVVQQGSKAMALLAGGSARELVAVNAATIDTSRGERFHLLIKGLVSRTDSGVAENGSG